MINQPHVANAYFGDIEPPSLDTHLCHVLPDEWILNGLDAFIRLVQIARGKKEGKIHYRLLHRLVHVIQPLEVLQYALMNPI